MHIAKRSLSAGDATWARRLAELGTSLGASETGANLLPCIDEHLLGALEAGRDDLLAGADAMWAGQPVGLAIRRRIESLAERVDIVSAGCGHTYGMFAIPVVLHMDGEFPESQLESLLASRLTSPIVEDAVRASRNESRQMWLAPRWYSYADLSESSPCRIRQHAVRMASEAVRHPPPSWPFDPVPRSMKRASTFLRFLVGVLEHPFMGRSNCPPVRIAALEHAVESSLSRRLHSPVGVVSRFDASFHEALYAGLWEYQTVRLKTVARTASCLSRDAEAVVHVPATGSKRRTRVGVLLRRDGPIEHAYLLRSRPGESAASVFGTTRDGLTAGGVLAVSAMPGATLGHWDETGWGTALPI